MNKRKSIFDIQQEYVDIISELEENEGEVTEEIQERLHINKNEIDDKLNAYAYITKEISGEILVLEEEIERLKNKITAKTNTIERLKSVCAVAVNTYGEINSKSKAKNPGKSYDTGKNKFVLVHTNPVIIRNEDTFTNDKFVTYSIKGRFKKSDLDKIAKLLQDEIEVNKNIDKAAIKKDIEAGIEIEDAYLDTNSEYLRTY